MIRRPPRSTRTDTLFPYTTLFRSARTCPSTLSVFGRAGITRTAPPKDESPNDVPCGPRSTSIRSITTRLMSTLALAAKPPEFVIGVSPKYVATVVPTSEERRVGLEGVSTCRSRWGRYPSNKNNEQKEEE